MKETEIEESERLAEYLKALKKFKERGVKVLIDGVERPESQWESYLKVRDESSFYMGDYIMEEEKKEKSILKEIRFDRISI